MLAICPLFDLIEKATGRRYRETLEQALPLVNTGDSTTPEN
jgi:hypothetical protein